MSNIIDREGVFKAKPLDWAVKRMPNSNAVAVNIRFAIVACLNEQNGWDDWTQYADVLAFGDFFVLKKDGGVNETTVKQLSESLGWNGSLEQIASHMPPECLVQISVKAETWNGNTRFKATWINPENFVPTGQGEDAASAKALDAQYGSLLRAAASSSAKPTGKPAKPAPKKEKRKPDPEAAANLTPDDFAPSSRDDTPF